MPEPSDASVIDSDAQQIRTLVARCLAGEELAAAELVDRCQGLVLALCYRMLGNRHDAEDAAQESLLRMLRSLKSWDAGRDFRPWLMAIAGNRCRTMLARRRRSIDAVPLAEYVPDRTPDEEPARTLVDEVNRALRTLRADHRQAFVLFHEHQMSYAQISDAMGCPVGTAKVWVHRARRQLIEQLRARGVVEPAAASAGMS
jgi:RNA polymerase sigma-70 factor, ECF subfamily